MPKKQVKNEAVKIGRRFDVIVAQFSSFQVFKFKCLVDKLSEMINRKLFLTIKRPYTF